MLQCYIQVLYVVSCTQRPKVGTAAICISDLYPGKFLVGRRQGSHGEGTYALPGGHLEAGEAWGESTLRELEEEAGITVDDVKTCSNTSMSIGGQLLKKPVEDTNALYATVTNGWMEAEALHYIDIYMLIHLKDSAKVENREPDKCEGKIPWQIQYVYYIYGIRYQIASCVNCDPNPGWSWVTPEELKEYPMFLPLQILLEQQLQIHT